MHFKRTVSLRNRLIGFIFLVQIQPRPTTKRTRKLNFLSLSPEHIAALQSTRQIKPAKTNEGVLLRGKRSVLIDHVTRIPEAAAGRALPVKRALPA